MFNKCCSSFAVIFSVGILWTVYGANKNLGSIELSYSEAEHEE